MFTFNSSCESSGSTRIRFWQLGFLLSLASTLVLSPGTVWGLTVSPADISGKDIKYRASASLETGKQNYNYNVNFGGEDQSFEESGKMNVLMLRNDFSIAGRVAIGLNLGFGNLDFGRLKNESSDELSLDGDIGFGGGLRVSTILLEDVLDRDWFADFQSFALASDPPRTNLQSEDWHLAFGARQKGDLATIEGGALIGGSQFHANGSSKGGTFVDVSGSQSERLGLFVNTKFPISQQMKGIGGLIVSDGIKINAGASYGFTFLDYTPRLSRNELEGSRSVPQEQRDLTVREYLARVKESISNENFGKALDWLNQALDEDPRNPETYRQIAHGYFLISEFDRSIKYMRYALEQNPANPDYRYQMGRILEESGYREEAAHQYQRSLELNPSHRKALFRLIKLKRSL